MPSIQIDRPSDAELIARFVSSKDEAAFSELMKRHWGFAFTIARRSLANDSLAEDATQQAFIALSKRAGSLSKDTPLGPWLFRAVSHESSNIRRREKRHQKRNHDYAATISEASQNQNHLSTRLYQALANLTGKERELILLRFYEGLTADQIAARLKITPAAAQRRTHRALDRLTIFANAQDEDQKSFQLSIPALLAPGILPPKDVLSSVMTSKTVVAGGLLLPATGWLIATTLSVSAIKQATPQVETPTESPAEVAVFRERKPRKKRTPIPPESPELARFVEIARTSPEKAFAWADEHFPLLHKQESFLKKAATYLAENELHLAKTLLSTRKEEAHRELWISAILRAGAAADDLPSAVRWLESLPNPQDHQACWATNIQRRELSKWFEQLEATLHVATTTPVKKWLAEEIIQYYKLTDESKILTLAETLDGEIRKQVISSYATIQLDRDSPVAGKLIHELKGDLYIDKKKVARRNPARFLNAVLPYFREDSTNASIKRIYAGRLVDEWFKLDPEGARAWISKNDPNDDLEFLFYQKQPTKE